MKTNDRGNLIQMRNNNYKIELDMEELFPIDWYKNVTNAANYVLSNMDIPDEKVDDVVLHIIDYNINKQLNNKLLNSVIDGLPQFLSFVDVPATSVFNELKTILDACDVCPSFKRHELYFQVSDMKYDKKRLSFWKKLIKKDYPNLKIASREIKSQQCIKLVISKK